MNYPKRKKKKVSRWIKYEQTLPDPDQSSSGMWSRPFVGALVYQSLLYLKTGLQYGTVIMNSEAEKVQDVYDEMVRDFVDSGHMNKESREQIKRTLMLKHRHNQLSGGNSGNSGKNSNSSEEISSAPPAKSSGLRFQFKGKSL